MLLHRYVAIGVCIVLAACGPLDSLSEGFSHSQAVSKKLEKTIGLKSFVGFNWNNGSLNSVNITFQGLPQKATLAEVADASKQAVLAEFKQTPKQIVVAFAVEP